MSLSKLFKGLLGGKGSNSASESPAPEPRVPAQQRQVDAPSPEQPSPTPIMDSALGDSTSAPARNAVPQTPLPGSSAVLDAPPIRTSSLPDFHDSSDEFPEIARIRNMDSLFPQDLSDQAYETLMKIGPKVLGFKPFTTGTGQEISVDRIRVAKACEDMQREVAGLVAEKTVRMYNYSPSSRAKCIRDIGLIFNWCVFCMLIEDPQLLEKHVMNWTRAIFEHLKFPDGTKSVTMAYAKLRKEVLARLSPQDGALIEPYLTLVVRSISHNQIQ